MAKIFITVLFFLCALIPALSYAEDYVGDDNPRNDKFQLVPCEGINDKGVEDCDFNALMTLINRVISFILYVSIPLAAISFSYAGYLYISAAGDTGKIEDAHKIFKSVLIGFIFIISAWLIVYTITNSLLGSDFKNSKANLLRNGGSGSGGTVTGSGGGGENSGDSGNGYDNIGDNNRGVTDVKDLQFDFGDQNSSAITDVKDLQFDFGDL